jgi:hypothetical protein
LERLLDGMDVLLSFTKINRSIMTNNKQQTAITNREENLQNPFFAPKEKYDDTFISGYSNAIRHMREAIGHIQSQNDTEELSELFMYSKLLIQKLKEKFSNDDKQ